MSEKIKIVINVVAEVTGRPKSVFGEFCSVGGNFLTSVIKELKKRGCNLNTEGLQEEKVDGVVVGVTIKELANRII